MPELHDELSGSDSTVFKERSWDEVSSSTEGNSTDSYQCVPTQLACWLSPAGSGEIGFADSISLVYFRLRGSRLLYSLLEGLLLHSGMGEPARTDSVMMFFKQLSPDCLMKRCEIVLILIPSLSEPCRNLCRGNVSRLNAKVCLCIIYNNYLLFIPPHTPTHTAQPYDRLQGGGFCNIAMLINSVIPA